ncbi:hypothetical protein LINPERHAP1_LOCUS24185 [Linum perenne]
MIFCRRKNAVFRGKLLSISCRFLPSPIPALPAARSALRLRPLRSLCSCPSIFQLRFLSPFSSISGSGVRSCRWDFSSILATTSSGNFSPPMTHNYPSIGDLILRNHSPAGSSAFLSPSAHSKLAVVDRWLVAQADGSSTADRNSASWVVSPRSTFIVGFMELENATNILRHVWNIIMTGGFLWVAWLGKYRLNEKSF